MVLLFTVSVPALLMPPPLLATFSIGDDEVGEAGGGDAAGFCKDRVAVVSADRDQVGEGCAAAGGGASDGGEGRNVQRAGAEQCDGGSGGEFGRVKCDVARAQTAASSSASRRLHDGSVPVPGVVWMVQLEAVPASSSTLVTTRFGLVTEIGPDMPVMLAVTVSVAVMDWLPGVASVALKCLRR